MKTPLDNIIPNWYNTIIPIWDNMKGELLMNCKKCNGEIDKKAVVCVHCGCKIKKPFYKKWWVWVIAVILVAAIAANSGGNEADVETSPKNENLAEVADETITYEAVELGVMIEELKNNAMKAESNYQDKNVEFAAKIKSFDSDGAYISVEPTNADEWNLDAATCYIKNEEQKNLLLDKNVGDSVTIKGTVKSVGEVLGYSIDIAEIK